MSNTKQTNEIDMSTQTYLLVKRDLYYRPNGAGYTGVKDEAARYTFDEVAAYIHSPDMGVDAVLESEAPEYRKACWPEVRAEHEAKKLQHLKEENERLRSALTPFAEAGSVFAKLDNGRPSGSGDVLHSWHYPEGEVSLRFSHLEAARKEMENSNE